MNTRYKEYWLLGLKEDINGDYCLQQDLEKALEQRDWECNKKNEIFTWYKTTQDELCNERVLSMLLSWFGFLMFLGNIIQLIYRFN